MDRAEERTMVDVVWLVSSPDYAVSVLRAAVVGVRQFAFLDKYYCCGFVCGSSRTTPRCIRVYCDGGRSTTHSKVLPASTSVACRCCTQDAVSFVVDEAAVV